MGHTPKTRVRRVKIPGQHASPGVPAVVLAKQSAEMAKEAQRQAGKMRRLLWLAVHKAGGRIELEDKDYTDAMALAPEDSIVAIRRDKETGKLTMIFEDEEGNILPESKRGVIITDR